MIDYLFLTCLKAKHPRKIPLSHHSAGGILVSLESSVSVTDPTLNPQPIEKRRVSGGFIHIPSIYF